MQHELPNPIRTALRDGVPLVVFAWAPEGFSPTGDAAWLLSKRSMEAFEVRGQPCIRRKAPGLEPLKLFSSRHCSMAWMMAAARCLREGEDDGAKDDVLMLPAHWHGFKDWGKLTAAGAVEKVGNAFGRFQGGSLPSFPWLSLVDGRLSLVLFAE